MSLHGRGARGVVALRPQGELCGGLQGQAGVEQVLHNAGHALPLELRAQTPEACVKRT
jgi:hypothetical protein